MKEGCFHLLQLVRRPALVLVGIRAVLEPSPYDSSGTVSGQDLDLEVNGTSHGDGILWDSA